MSIILRMSTQEKCERSSILNWDFFSAFKNHLFCCLQICIWIWVNSICICRKEIILFFVSSLEPLYAVTAYFFFFFKYQSQYTSTHRIWKIHSVFDISDESKHKIPLWSCLIMVCGCRANVLCCLLQSVKLYVIFEL